MNATEDTIKISLVLYGSLARFGNGRHVAKMDLSIQAGTWKNDLLAQLGVPQEERGYLFINAVLNDVPGLTTRGDRPLQDGDHMGVFSIHYMWPYQYRDGIPMSESLKNALSEKGAMHHSYKPPVNTN